MEIHIEEERWREGLIKSTRQLRKYILQFEQIHLTIWTNTFLDLPGWGEERGATLLLLSPSIGSSFTELQKTAMHVLLFSNNYKCYGKLWLSLRYFVIVDCQSINQYGTLQICLCAVFCFLLFCNFAPSSPWPLSPSLSPSPPPECQHHHQYCHYHHHQHYHHHHHGHTGKWGR